MPQPHDAKARNTPNLGPDADCPDIRIFRLIRVTRGEANVLSRVVRFFKEPDSRIPGFQDSKGSRLRIPNRAAIASSRYHLR
ncbi:MAG: hypothetical protein IPN69_02080 [Acidobacteria bacterium]|nr:hypothetical protein [Acidobacteriota bacterium]